MKRLTLGIDTGGTYTDVVLLEKKTAGILGWAKALTTYEDFSLGITEAMKDLVSRVPFSSGEIEFAALSTTLATNAAVEGRIRPHSLLLIGYDESSRQSALLEKNLSAGAKIFHIPGGHDGKGDEIRPLDEALIRRKMGAIASGAASVAVSSLFGVRNPSHELRAKKIVEEATSLPVSCGHELSSKLDAYVRATTVSMNAGLIPVLRELLFAVRNSLSGLGIDAPLMVVRGDGSLVNLDWAISRPMETLLSGPVASAKGGYRLATGARKRDIDLCCVVDMGGTTSDIIILEDGRAKVAPSGAKVGPHRTHIEAVDIRTLALGGDILVTVEEKDAVLGTRRVLPVGRLAERHPDAARIFAEAFFKGDAWAKSPLFAVPTDKFGDYGHFDNQAIAALQKNEPALLSELLAASASRTATLKFLEELEGRGELLWSGFTPTDALHAAGKLKLYDSAICAAVAEKIGAAAGLSADAFCDRVFSKIAECLRKEIVKKTIQSELGDEDAAFDGTLLSMIAGERSLATVKATAELRHTIIGIGAPADAYIPDAARTIARDVVVPAFAMVAGAVGAASGGLRLSYDLAVVPIRGGLFRALSPTGPEDYEDLDQAIAASRTSMDSWMKKVAEAAGAQNPQIAIREERTFVPTSGGAEIFLQAVLHCEVFQE